MYTLDTNAVIYYLKGEAKAVSTLNKVFKEIAPIYISTITEVEMFTGTILVTRNTNDFKNIPNFSLKKI